jgi:hypothetical protein
MAAETGIGHDRPDIAIETDSLLPKRTGGNSQNYKESHGTIILVA